MEKWYQKTGSEVLGDFGVTTDGLTAERASELLRRKSFLPMVLGRSGYGLKYCVRSSLCVRSPAFLQTLWKRLNTVTLSS